MEKAMSNKKNLTEDYVARNVYRSKCPCCGRDLSEDGSVVEIGTGGSAFRAKVRDNGTLVPCRQEPFPFNVVCCGDCGAWLRRQVVWQGRDGELYAREGNRMVPYVQNHSETVENRPESE